MTKTVHPDQPDGPLSSLGLRQCPVCKGRLFINDKCLNCEKTIRLKNGIVVSSSKVRRST